MAENTGLAKLQGDAWQEVIQEATVRSGSPRPGAARPRVSAGLGSAGRPQAPFPAPHPFRRAWRARAGPGRCGGRLRAIPGRPGPVRGRSGGGGRGSRAWLRAEAARPPVGGAGRGGWRGAEEGERGGRGGAVGAVGTVPGSVPGLRWAGPGSDRLPVPPAWREESGGRVG